MKSSTSRPILAAWLAGSISLVAGGCPIIDVIDPARPDGRTPGSEAQTRAQLADLSTELADYNEQVVGQLVPENQRIGTTAVDCLDPARGIGLLAGTWTGELTDAENRKVADLRLVFDATGELVSLLRANAGLPAFDLSFQQRDVDTFPSDSVDLIIKPLSTLVQCLDAETRTYLVDATILCDVDASDAGRTRLIQRLTLLVTADAELSELSGAATTVNDVIASVVEGTEPGASSSTATVRLNRMEPAAARG